MEQAIKIPGLDWDGSQWVKYCPRCRLTKSVYEFNSRWKYLKTKAVGDLCLKCRRVPARKRSVPVKYKPDKLVAKWHNFRAKLRRMRITLADVILALRDQDCKCAICLERLTPSVHFDHDHATDHFRGLLCGQCNLGLGHFKDDPKTVLRASKYLEMSKNAYIERVCKSFVDQ